MDDAIINGDTDIPDLNAEVDPEDISKDFIAIMPAQQSLLAWEVVGLTLFGFDLNAPLATHGEDNQVQSDSADRWICNAINRLEVNFVGPMGRCEITLDQQVGEDKPTISVGEDSGLGLDHFNLMPIMTRMKLNNWARSNARSSPREIREVEDKLTCLLGQPFTDESIKQKNELIGKLNRLLE